MKRVLILFAAMLCGLNPARAGGFEQPNQSASAAGVANAFTAAASDASALLYNPAGMAWLSGVSVMGTAQTDYRNSAVATATLDAPNNGSDPFTGAFCATWTPLQSRLSAGFGFSPLYLINNDWSVAFPGGAGSTAGITKLTVDHASFDTAYALSSSLAIGLGADWYLTRATLTQGTNNFKGNDFTSFGGHASLMWKPYTGWSLGAMLRSGARVNISGGAGQQLSFKLPDSVRVGMARDFADVWRLETDLKWTRWSALKNMNVSQAGAIVQPNALNLRDTITVMAGLTWSWRENTQFRIGYAYDQGANRTQGFNPIMADQDGHRISLGAGGDLFGMHMDLAYQYGFYSKQSATGPFAGVYRDRRQSLLFSVSNTFD